jgi:predicted HicB family RNase H-like nuclease
MLGVMRVTIRLDERLYADAGAEAARSGQTLSAFVEGALREVPAERRVALHQFDGHP